MSTTTCNDNSTTVKLSTPKLGMLNKLLKERKGMVPVWVRAPSHGPEFFSGISRAKLYDLAAKGLVKTKSITDSGKERGCRLWQLRSVLEYIENHPGEQETAEAV